MDQAPRQACKENTILERFFPGGFLFATATVVDEHEIEIRTITEFPPTQLAVADDGESRATRDTLIDTARFTVSRLQIPPGDL